MSKYHIVENHMSRLKCFNNYHRINVSLRSSRADFLFVDLRDFFQIKCRGGGRKK